MKLYIIFLIYIIFWKFQFSFLVTFINEWLKLFRCSLRFIISAWTSVPVPSFNIRAMVALVMESVFTCLKMKCSSLVPNLLDFSICNLLIAHCSSLYFLIMYCIVGRGSSTILLISLKDFCFSNKLTMTYCSSTIVSY